MAQHRLGLDLSLWGYTPLSHSSTWAMIEDKGASKIPIGANGRPKPQIDKLIRAYNATSRMEPAIS